MKWWEADLINCRVLMSSKIHWIVAGAQIRLLCFSHSGNLLYLSYALAKESGRENIRYELTGGVALQLTLSDVAKVLSRVEESEEPFSLVLVIDGKEREVFATPVKVPPSNGTCIRET